MQFFLQLVHICDIGGVIQLILLRGKLLCKFVVALLNLVDHDFVAGFQLLVLVVELASRVNQLVKFNVQLLQLLHNCVLLLLILNLKQNHDMAFDRIATHLLQQIDECARMNYSQSETTKSIKDILQSLMTPIDPSLKTNKQTHYYYEELADIF